MNEPDEHTVSPSLSDVIELNFDGLTSPVLIKIQILIGKLNFARDELYQISQRIEEITKDSCPKINDQVTYFPSILNFQEVPRVAETAEELIALRTKVYELINLPKETNCDQTNYEVGVTGAASSSSKSNCEIFQGGFIEWGIELLLMMERQRRTIFENVNNIVVQLGNLRKLGLLDETILAPENSLESTCGALTEPVRSNLKQLLSPNLSEETKGYQVSLKADQGTDTFSDPDRNTLASSNSTIPSCSQTTELTKSQHDISNQGLNLWRAAILIYIHVYQRHLLEIQDDITSQLVYIYEQDKKLANQILGECAREFVMNSPTTELEKMPPFPITLTHILALKHKSFIFGTNEISLLKLPGETSTPQSVNREELNESEAIGEGEADLASGTATYTIDIEPMIRFVHGVIEKEEAIEEIRSNPSSDSQESAYEDFPQDEEPEKAAVVSSRKSKSKKKKKGSKKKKK